MKLILNKAEIEEIVLAHIKSEFDDRIKEVRIRIMDGDDELNNVDYSAECVAELPK